MCNAGLQQFMGYQGYSYLFLSQRWAASWQACGGEQARVTEEDNCHCRLCDWLWQVIVVVVPAFESAAISMFVHCVFNILVVNCEPLVCRNCLSCKYDYLKILESGDWMSKLFLLVTLFWKCESSFHFSSLPYLITILSFISLPFFPPQNQEPKLQTYAVTLFSSGLGLIWD